MTNCHARHLESADIAIEELEASLNSACAYVLEQAVDVVNDIAGQSPKCSVPPDKRCQATHIETRIQWQS
jgi:hypothetical protein